MIMKFQKIFLISSILLFGCEREIDISEFSDDFSHYEPELRIEALILPGDNTAIVRIDHSALVTDTELYNCIDEDDDWNINYDDLGIDGVAGDPTDENENCDFGAEGNDPCLTEPSEGEGNGLPDCGEPHVDEADEIITQLHVSNCNVSMSNGDAICNFKYDESANSYWYFPYDKERDDLDFVEESFYGGYIPDESCADFDWNDYEGDYSFECDCENYGSVVSKEPIQISPPIIFFNESDVDTLESFLLSADQCLDIDCLKQNSTLWNSENNSYDKRYFGQYAIEDYIYYSSLMPYVYFQSVQYFYDPIGQRYIYLHGHPDAATDACEECGIHQNITTMKEVVITDIIEFGDPVITTVDNYYYEMFTFSDSYRNYYFYDQLDLLDPERTNLRKLDSNGEPTGMIMGAFGSMTSEKIFFEIIDCGKYELQEECENEELAHFVCQWSGNVCDIKN